MPVWSPTNFAFANLVLEGGGPIQVGLNDIIRNAAAAPDAAAVVAETAPRETPPLLIGKDDLVGDCLHPNNSGHTKIADAFADVIDIPEVTGPPALDLSSN